METREKRFKNSHCDKVVNNCNSQNQIAIHKLNEDCLTNIFKFLQIIDRVKIESVCKRWRDVGKKSWQNVKTLDQSVATWGFDICAKPHRVKRDIFKTVLQRCGLFLRHLDLSSICTVFTDGQILHCVGKFCPNLQFIDVGPLKLTVTTVKLWTKNCHNLTEITLGNSTKACNDTQLSNLFLKNKQLESLKIRYNYTFTGECLLSLPVNMKVIIIQNCRSISFNHLHNALERFGQLKTFSVVNSGRSVISQNIHTMPTTLKILEIPWCSSFNIDCIIQMNNLEKLVVTGVQLVTDSLLVTLAANCKTLYHLSINGCTKVTNVGLQAVARLPKIEYLSLENLSNINDSALTYIPNLKKLFCSNCRNIKDNGICTLIETCDSIQVLDLSFCTQITNTLVECAINVTKNRTNNLVLNLYLEGTSVDPDKWLVEYRLLKMTLPFRSESSFDGSDDSWFGGYESYDDMMLFDNGYEYDEYDDYNSYAEIDSEEDEEVIEDTDFSEQEDVEDKEIADTI